MFLASVGRLFHCFGHFYQSEYYLKVTEVKWRQMKSTFRGEEVSQFPVVKLNNSN